MKYIRHDEYIRVGVSEYADIKDIISQIKRHIDGVEYVGIDCDSCSYMVDNHEYHHRAEAILAKLSFEDNFSEESEIILCDHYNDYEIVCSRIENDINDGTIERTDRTRYYNKNTYEIIEILANQPYIHYFDSKDEKLKKAFMKLSEEIIKAKKIDDSVLTPQ